MGKIFMLLLLSLFIAFFSGLMGANMFQSESSSPDKLLKLGLIYLLLIMISMRKNRGLKESALGYLIPAMVFISILAFHHFTTLQAPFEEMLSAKKDLVKLVAYLIILVLCSAVPIKMKDYRFLMYTFAAFGVPLALLSVRYASTAVALKRTRQVGEFVRAGSDVISVNNLGAVFNIATMCAILVVLTTKKPIHKIIFILAAIASQIGRFFTFSNGSAVNLIVTVAVALFLLRRHDKQSYSQMRKICFILLLGISSLVIVSGKGTVLLSRLSQTDDTSGMPVSVASRVDQYKGLLELMTNSPLKLVFGVGAANVPKALGTTITLHNAYLLPLVSAGIFGFASFMFLWWRSLKNFYAAVKCSIGNRDDTILTTLILASYLGYSVQILTVPYCTATTLWFFFILAYSFGNYAREGRLASEPMLTGVGACSSKVLPSDRPVDEGRKPY
jgi:hypothetical protein